MTRKEIPEYRAKTQLWTRVAMRLAGSQKRLAHQLSASQSAVSQWLRGVSIMQPEFCEALAKLCHCKASDIRPDVFKE